MRCAVWLRVETSDYQTMSNEQFDQPAGTAPVPSPSPSVDSQNRLSAARDFACAQYEKLRRAAVSQLESVRNYTQDARRQLNEGWDVTRAKAKDLHKAGEDYVRENPTSSVLYALGAGILLGLLLGSGRR